MQVGRRQGAHRMHTPVERQVGHLRVGFVGRHYELHARRLQRLVWRSKRMKFFSLSLCQSTSCGGIIFHFDRTWCFLWASAALDSRLLNKEQVIRQVLRVPHVDEALGGGRADVHRLLVAVVRRCGVAGRPVRSCLVQAVLAPPGWFRQTRAC